MKHASREALSFFEFYFQKKSYIKSRDKNKYDIQLWRKTASFWDFAITLFKLLYKNIWIICYW